LNRIERWWWLRSLLAALFHDPRGLVADISGIVVAVAGVSRLTGFSWLALGARSMIASSLDF